MRGGDQWEVVVLVAEVSAAGADEDSGRVRESRGRIGVESLAPRRPRAVLDRTVRGVQAEHVGAADELQQLAVAGQCAGVVVGNLGRDAGWPVAGIPLRDRTDRRRAGIDRREDLRGRASGSADGAGSGDDDAWRCHGGSRISASRRSARRCRRDDGRRGSCSNPRNRANSTARAGSGARAVHRARCRRHNPGRGRAGWH